MNLLFVAIGGALGAGLRYAVGQWQASSAHKFPFGTVIVNVIGSFLLGWLIGAKTGEIVFALLGVGFCGAFTTFSTIQWELFQLHKQQAYRLLFIYALVTYGAGWLSAIFGYWIAMQ